MSLCFLLLRGQFHHFSGGATSASGAVGGGAQSTTIPGGGQLQQLVWRNPTKVDEVACQLIVRCILRVHQALAERANAHRECAQAFMNSGQKGET